jgi:hypothetical protein
VDILREITLFKLDSWRFVREEDLHSSMGSGLVDGVPELPDRRSSLPSITEGQQQQQQQQQQQPASSAAAFAQKLNQELDKRIGEPLKRHLTQIPARFRRAASMLVMKNGRMERNTGFAFSQQPGIVSHLSKLGVGSPITLRRRASKFNSDSALEKQPAGRLGSSQSIAASDRGEAANSAAARNNSISPPYWVQHLQRALNPRSRRGSNVSGTSSKRSHGPSSAPASPALSPTTFPAVAVPTDGQSAVQSLSQTEVMLPGAAVVTNVSEGECEENNLSTKIDD